MRWRTAGCCVLSLLALTGCPETHRRGGRADRAAHKDLKEGLEPSACTEDVYENFCLEDEESEECLQYCGE